MTDEIIQSDVMPLTVQEVAPQPEEQDVENLTREKAQRREAQDAVAWAMAMRPPEVEEEDPAGDGDQPAEEAPDPDDERGILRSLVHNLSPIEALGGALDAVDESFGAIRDISESGNAALMEMGIPGLVFGGEGGLVSMTTDAQQLAETDDIGGMLPDIGDPEDAGLARNVGKFLTGFVGAGKLLKPLGAFRALGEGGRGAQAAQAAIKGGIADFAVFDEMDNAVDGLIESFPSLDAVLPDFLEADEEDPAVVNRLRNTLFGLGMGGATDSVMAGLRLARSGRFARPALKEADKVLDQAQTVATTQKTQIAENLGDPDAVELVTRSAPTSGGEPGGVMVNWARIDSSDDVKQVIQEMADSFSDGIDTARRGSQTFEETARLAQEEDAWRLLSERSHGSTFNAEQTLAVRNLWTSSGRKVLELAQKVQAGGSLADEVSFRKMLAVHATIQEQVVAARTETARALSQWRIPAGESDQFLGGMEVLMTQLDMDRSTKNMAESITTLTAMGRTDAADAFVYSAGRMGKLSKYATNASDMIRQLYYASLLSGPHTHARNIISNTGMLGLNAVERKGAALLGKALGGQNVPDGEASAMMHGTVQGFRDAFRVSAQARQTAVAEGRRAHTPVVDAFLTGESGKGVGKVDAKAIGAFSSEKLRLDPTSPVGRVFDWIDTATSIPTRGLMAADEVYKTSNFRAEIHARAFRQAHKEMEAGQIQAGDEFMDRLTTLTNNPDESMRLHALNHAETSTFTNRPEDTSFWRGARHVARIGVLGKMILPFSRTPYNLAIESFQRLPMAPLTKKWRDDILAGGARGDIAWSKFLTGNALLLVMGDFALSGYITGENKGLSDGSGKRQTKGRLGDRAMTIRTSLEPGARRFSYRGLEPFSSTIGIAASAVEILQSEDFEDEDNDALDVTVAATLAIMSQLTSANYMSGMTALIEALSDPTRYGESYFERLLSPVVPTGVAQITRAQDPIIREVNEYLDAIKARTPGLSDSLPPRRDFHGRAMSRESGLGTLYDSLSPVYSSKADVEPIDIELNRLEAWVGKPSKNTSFDGVNVNLKTMPEIYDRYLTLAGNDLTENEFGGPIMVPSIGYVSEGQGRMDELNAIVSGNHSFSAKYEMGSDGADGDKAAFIRAIVNAYNGEARKRLLEDFPELRAEVQSRADEKPVRNFGNQRLRAFGGGTQ